MDNLFDQFDTSEPVASVSIPDLVVRHAGVAGLDPAMALAVADIESSMGRARNTPGSRYTGLYQLGPDRIAQFGGDDDYNTPEGQAAIGVRSLADSRRGLAAKLGRTPTAAETYLAHQQGVAGSHALLTAPEDAIASDVLAPFYRNGNNVRAITGNLPASMRRPDITAGEFRNHWRDRFGRSYVQYGGIDAGDSPADHGGGAGSGNDRGTYNLAGATAMAPNGEPNPFDQFDEPQSSVEANPFDQFDDLPSVTASERPSLLGEAGNAAARAGRAFLADAIHSPAQMLEEKIADWTGSESLKKTAAEDRDALEAFRQKTAQEYPASVTNVTDVKNGDDAARYVIGQGIGALPTIAQFAATGVPGLIAGGALEGAAREYEHPDSTAASIATGAGTGAAMNLIPVPFLHGAAGKSLAQQVIRGAGGMGAMGAINPSIHEIPRAVATGDTDKLIPTYDEMLNSMASGAIQGGMFGAYGAARTPRLPDLSAPAIETEVAGREAEAAGAVGAEQQGAPDAVIRGPGAVEAKPATDVAPSAEALVAPSVAPAEGIKEAAAKGVSEAVEATKLEPAAAPEPPRMQAGEIPEPHPNMGESPSLLRMLASHGGIRDEGGELAQLDLLKQSIPGIGKLVRPDGLTLEQARALAEERGYLRPSDATEQHGRTEINDLLSAIDAEARGNPVYPQGVAPEKVKKLQTQNDALSSLEIEADRLGIDTNGMTPKQIDRAIRDAYASDQFEADEEARAIYGKKAKAHTGEELAALKDADLEPKDQAPDDLHALLAPDPWRYALKDESGKPIEDKEGKPVVDHEGLLTRLHEAIMAQFRHYGLPEDFGVRLVNGLRDPVSGAQGDALYRKASKLIDVALTTKGADFGRRVFHEALHVLADPDLKLLKPHEIERLNVGARAWLDMQHRDGGTNRDWLRRVYKDRVLKPEDMMDEARSHWGEMVYNKLLHPPKLTRAVIDKIGRTMEAIRNGFHGLGFRSSEGFMRSIEAGRLNARQYERQPGESAEAHKARLDRAAATRIMQPYLPQDIPGTHIKQDGDKYAIRAWHGTPHDFDRFDIEKIGTGEGAQAYGHGLYFAGNRKVAEGYRKSLGKYSASEIEKAKQAIIDKGLSKNPEEDWGFGDHNDYVRLAREAANYEPKETPGRLFEVSLRPDEHELLDWDKPLSEQSEGVRKILAPLVDRLVAEHTAEVPGYSIKRSAAEMMDREAQARDIVSRMTGEKIYEAVATEGYRKNGTGANHAAYASAILREAGIPGIRYLDAGSRATSGGEIVDISARDGKWFAKIRVKNRGGVGFADPTDTFTTSRGFDTEAQAKQWADSKINEGSRNYVIFDDADVSVQGKYALKEESAKNAHIIGHGTFGQITNDFAGNWRGAALWLEHYKNGDAIGALHHPEVGPIDLVWGKEGSNDHDGFGLSKLIAWHPEALQDLQGLIDGMQVSSKTDNRIRLKSYDGRATVRLDYNGQSKKWLLTAYDVKVPRRTEKSTTRLSEIWGERNSPTPRQGTDENITTPAPKVHPSDDVYALRDQAEKLKGIARTAANSEPVRWLTGTGWWRNSSDAFKAATDDIQMFLSPMAVRGERGSDRAAALVKRAADAERAITFRFGQVDQLLKNRFKADERAQMGRALDLESVHEQRLDRALQQMQESGEPPEAMAEFERQTRDKWQASKKGIAGLNSEQRFYVDLLAKASKETWQQLKAAGVIPEDARELPFYMPRMLVKVLADGGISKVASDSQAAAALDVIGANVRTSGPKRRKYLTPEETEAAAKLHFGDDTELVTDIRALPLALAQNHRSINGRRLIDSIEAVGKRLGMDMAVDPRELPTSELSRFFTLAHPSFTRWQPKLETRIVSPEELNRRGIWWNNDGTDQGLYKGKAEIEMAAPGYKVKGWGDDGKPIVEHKEPVIDSATGKPVMERVQLHIAREFEGPLRAFLTSPSGGLYNGLMKVKGLSMQAIMYSPMIHLGVEYGRAFPLMPGKMLTLRVFKDGNAFRHGKDGLATADYLKAIEEHHLAPIGQSWYQDITGIAADAKLGDRGKIMGALDKFGHFWHQTLLWDRIADLQAGIYVNMKEQFQRHGKSEHTAGIMAAHLANRYAGALPKESMGEMARRLANVFMFSRSYTIGNLGVMKDVINGIPRDVRASISAADRVLATKEMKSEARKALMLDLALFYSMNSALQIGFQALGTTTMSATAGGAVAGALTGGAMAGPVGALAGAIAGGAMGLGTTKDKIEQERSPEEMMDDAVWRLGALAHHLYENPLDVINPFDMAERLTPNFQNEEGKRNRIWAGREGDNRGIYVRNPLGKFGEDIGGWITSPDKLLHNKGSQLFSSAMQILSNKDSFGHRVYRDDDPSAAGKLKAIGDWVWHIMKGHIPTGAIEGLYDAAIGMPRGEIAAMKAIGPLFGVGISSGYPGGPDVGNMAAAERRLKADQEDARPIMKRRFLQGRDDEAQRIGEDAKFTQKQINSTQQSAVNPRSGPSKSLARKFDRTANEEMQDELERVTGGPR